MQYDQDIEDLLGPPTSGDPRTNRGQRITKDLGPLQDLLLRVCPPDRDGAISVPILSRHLEMSPWGVYKWIRNAKIPGNKVTRLVELSAGRVRLDELLPYVLK